MGTARGGPITTAGAEGSEAHDRPPLSKAGLIDALDARFRPRDWYAEHGVSLRLGAPAVRLRAAFRSGARVTVTGASRIGLDQRGAGSAPR